MTAIPTPREAIERAIEALVVLLDAFEPDPDLEPAGDEEDGHEADLEPSLGGGGTWTDAGLQYDLEEDRSDYEPDADAEPSLGWTTSGAIVGDDDREHDPAELGEPEEAI